MKKAQDLTEWRIRWSMLFFDYDKDSPQAVYYESLQALLEYGEHEIVEFKEAKGGYPPEKLGQYFSAISNEANLQQRQYGWFILGVSESKDRHIVGTAFKKGDHNLLEKLKHEISQGTTDGMSFSDVIELYPQVEGKELRVLMFKIPAATTGMPTAWHQRYYGRAGESLIPLAQFKIDEIRSQERKDWSKQVIPNASLAHLDESAIQLARKMYKEKNSSRPHIIEEVASMSDEEFLTKLKLIINGKITNAAMLLLGKEDFDYLFSSAPGLMWRLYGESEINKDYELFKTPFIQVVDKVFKKVRNLTYRYMPNQLTLFPEETKQYDEWLLRELLNNCIAHSNYQLGGRIYVNEYEDRIIISNPGDFLPGNIEEVLKTTYSPPFYRNQLLAEAMRNFNMIDTASMGIRKVFRIQKDKYFPMPDYDISNSQVAVTVYGKTLDEKYTRILFEKDKLDLKTVYLLDRVQKHYPLSQEDVDFLRKYKLVEGRKNHLYLSEDLSNALNEKSIYIKNKAFNDQYYRDLIVGYLKKFKKAKKKDIKELLWNKLSNVLNDKQKNCKVTSLLMSLRNKGIIKTDSDNKQNSYWVLTD